MIIFSWLSQFEKSPGAMPPQTSIRTFLVKAKDALQQGVKSKSKLTFVIGNESADLDSMTSSLVYAYIRSTTSPPQQFGSLYIPVTNIPAADIKLRPEFLALLPHAGLKASNLITLDDLPMDSLKSKLAPESTQWILVDHNALQGVLGSIYGSRVVGTIDHHDEEHKVPIYTGIQPRIIEKTGSCTSLIVNHLKDQWDSIPTENVIGKNELATWNKEAAELALASILIDTANLKDRNKVTKHDEDAVRYLDSKLGSFDRNSLYKELQNAKQDIGSLCLTDILRKDYKQWDCGSKKLGIASVVKPLEFLVGKANADKMENRQNISQDQLTESILRFAQIRGLDVMVIMTAFASEDGDFQREILAVARSKDAFDDIEKFERTAGEELQLQGWSGPGIIQRTSENKPFIKVWRQAALQHSRKRVAPLFREALEQESKSDSQL
jgi:exopolyphosphatase